MTAWRRPLLFVGAAALYLGVVVTGMSLPFLPAAAIGLAALLSYTALMRPVKTWAPSVPVFTLSLLVLAVVAAICVGIGAALAAWLPAPPPATGPFLAAIGVILARISWSAARTEQMNEFLDGAIAELDGIAKQLQRQQDEHEALVREIALRDPIAADRVDHLHRQLAALPEAQPDRAAALDALLLPFHDTWSEDLDYLFDPEDAASVEAAAQLLLSPQILPAAFGHPSVDPVLRAAFFEQGPDLSEAMAQRALALDLDAAECWRLLPASDALLEHARLLDDPPALSALAAAIADREAEDDQP